MPMHIGVVTIFPEMFSAITGSGITRRAVESGLLEVALWNPRDYTEDRHRTVDDKPFGGGPGMVMKAPPLRDAITAAKAAAKAAEGHDAEVVYLSPQGKPLDQATLAELATRQSLVMVAGRYEGVDERVIAEDVDWELSIGDFVVSGGELPVMVVIDGITRLLPGAVGDPASVSEDSFVDGLLDYPHYTRPDEFEGSRVPPVLISGDHEKIRTWRRQQSLGRTWEKRPDLLDESGLNETDKRLLEAYQRERRDEQN